MTQPQDESTGARLLADVHVFVNDTGMSESRLLRRAGVHLHTLRQLREGRSCTLTTHDKIRKAMAAERKRRSAEQARPQVAPEDKPGDQHQQEEQ